MVATERLVIAMLLDEYLSSGLAPRLPISITLFMPAILYY
jgi:hypothetical protein